MSNNEYDESRYDKMFDAADPDASDKIPGGVYDAEIIAAQFKISKNGKDMISIGYEILAGEYLGRQVWTNYFPGNAYGMKLFKKLIQKVEFPRKTFSDIKENLHELRGYTLSISVTNDGDFTNVDPLILHAAPACSASPSNVLDEPAANDYEPDADPLDLD